MLREDRRCEIAVRAGWEAPENLPITLIQGIQSTIARDIHDAISFSHRNIDARVQWTSPKLCAIERVQEDRLPIDAQIKVHSYTSKPIGVGIRPLRVFLPQGGSVPLRESKK